jgi:uncharacterized protein (TIGR03435 family)
VCAALAASATAQPVSYVASVKPNVDPNAKTLSEYSPGGRFTATAITAATLVRMAYRVQSFQVVGAPSWLAERRYDVAAKVEDATAPPLQTFLQALLKERFGLEVHRETREMPVLALRVARADGRLGPGLAQSAFDCGAYLGGPHPPPEPGKTPPCATRINPGLLSGKAIPMSRLAGGLAALVERSVIDRTGLAGGFDVELTWSADDAGLSIYTALVEQLGLRLVAERGPVEVLVVDRVAAPSVN